MSKQFHFSRVFDILPYQLWRYPQENAINIFSDNKWQATSTTRLMQLVDNFSCWLISQGYNKGDMLAIMPRQGNLDWLIIDFACQQLGIIIVPIHPTSTAEDINLIFAETKPVLLIVTDSQLRSQVESYLQTTNKIRLFSIDNEVQTLHDAYPAKENEIGELLKRKAAVKPEDILTIMYTSGTSGTPKGVILTHRNMVSNILFTLAAFPLEPSRRVMSYLPFSHILERSASYAYLACGAAIYFVRSRESFLEDFQSAKPYFTTAVPKVLEKMYDFLQEQTLSQNRLKRILTLWAIETAKRYNKQEQRNVSLSLKLFIARILVLNKWKNQLGGKLQCIVVGAASLRPEIARMFSAAKIRIREGYGMTESSPLISLNRFSPGLNRFGTVGIPVPAMDLKIADKNEDGEGELWIKGPNVSHGYFNRPELNKEVFTKDGWFKTGDVGKIIDGKFLQITDRKKDIFKTSAGKYIAPQPLENILKSSPYISQCLVIGFGRPFVAALIVPNFYFLEDWCLIENIHWTSPQYMVHNIKVQEKLKQEIDKINQSLANYTQIKKIVLNHEEWTIENKLLTTTLKPIRKSLLKLNEKDINKIFS